MTKTITDPDEARAEIENLRLDIMQICRQHGLDAREFIVDYGASHEPGVLVDKCLAAGCENPPMRASFCEAHNARVLPKGVQILSFTHWSKDFLVPYDNCLCQTCVTARSNKEPGAASPDQALRGMAVYADEVPPIPASAPSAGLTGDQLELLFLSLDHHCPCRNCNLVMRFLRRALTSTSVPSAAENTKPAPSHEGAVEATGGAVSEEQQPVRLVGGPDLICLTCGTKGASQSGSPVSLSCYRSDCPNSLLSGVRLKSSEVVKFADQSELARCREIISKVKL